MSKEIVERRLRRLGAGLVASAWLGAAPLFAQETPPAAPAGPSAPAAAPSGAPVAEAPAPKPKPKPRPPAPPRETALSDDPTPVLQPETFFTTSKASERYAQIVEHGGEVVADGAKQAIAVGGGHG